MARGVGRLMGIRLMLNFNNPYLATDWAISGAAGTSACRPGSATASTSRLGGNRHGEVRTYVNMVLTMLISGLWHGAMWTFVMWGAVHAAGRVCTRACRGRLMAETCRAGSMLAVTLNEAETLGYLEDGLALAAVNSPQLCVVSGPAGDIQRLKGRLEAEGVACRLVHASHAFHSHMMEPILERFKERVAQVPLSPPVLPYLSNLTGTWITAEQATDPDYWAADLRLTVRFSQGIGEMCQASDLVPPGSGSRPDPEHAGQAAA